MTGRGRGSEKLRNYAGDSMKRLEQLYEGKAKILYSTDNPDLLIQYFKDDATAFNAEKKGTIKDKGIINNKVSSRIFEYLEDKGVKTHFVERMSDREMLAKKVEIIPLGGFEKKVRRGR